MTPHDEHREDLTPEEISELGALLVAERPRPREAFAAQLDARVAARFARARPSADAPARARRWTDALRHSFLLPAAATAAVALVALVVVLGGGGTDRGQSPDGGALSAPSQSAPEVAAEAPSLQRDAAADSLAAGGESAPAGADADKAARGRKVERSATLELGAPAEQIDDVAQDVLGVVARFDGIVDQSNVSSSADGGEAHFALRIPAAELQATLAALSRLPDAQVLARTDDAVDINQAYVSVRRQLANARAERAGVVRALRAADTEAETLRLRARLDELERTIALAERAQRALDRRVGYSRVTVDVRADERARDDGASGPFTIGSAFHDGLRVLEVAAGVLVIAAAALLPLALLLACAWPLARALARRRREQALDAA
jgi:Domain of unknown function (DUF4349)